MTITHKNSVIEVSEIELRALVLMARLWKNYAEGSRRELIHPSDLETEGVASKLAESLLSSRL